MIIRKWLESDNLKVSEIEKDCFSDYWTLKMIEDSFSNTNFLGFVCEEDGVVIGYLATICCLDECEINLIAVDKNHRRKHVATNLITTLINELKSNDVKKLFF